MFEPIDILFHQLPTSTDGKYIPFQMSVPFGIGQVTNVKEIGIECQGQEIFDVNVKVIRTWKDGSLRWCRLTWMQPFPGVYDRPKCRIVFQKTPAISNRSREPGLGWEANNECNSTFQFGWMSQKLDSRIRLVDDQGQEFFGCDATFEDFEPGQLGQWTNWKAQLRSSLGAESALELQGSIQLFAPAKTAIIRLTIRNPQPAVHPNGNWDLGNPGSIYLKDLSIDFSPQAKTANPTIGLSADFDEHIVAKNYIKLFQASSGGENWQSSNHLDREHRVPMSFRGYRVDADGQTHHGLRATPQIILSSDSSTFALGMRNYWENFPKCIEADQRSIRLALFPEECGYLHELQGGEQKTHEFAIYFGNRRESPLQWYMQEMTASLTPEYYAHVAAVPYLTPRKQDPNTAHLQLVDLAIEGSDTFLSKREKIDEYGWRNFGDVYGDHEAVFHDGPTPLISHYNNQYDCTGAFAIQFMRSGDFRWWNQMIAMADHAWDIDTYHTHGDKSLYNGGLFWHTYHYADADTGNHRSYPRSLSNAGEMKGGKDLKLLGNTGKKLAKIYAIGGGPSASQNYSTGWMWAYYLTGIESYRDAAINAAEYVIRIEDGRKTIFRWLSGSDTGFASESSDGYHGPGRASANSLHALLTGYELTGDVKFLSMAEKLNLRVAHPDDKVDSLDLSNAELRWFYTMYLQALTRYVDIKRENVQNDMHYARAIATLHRYADWMLEHERPTLEQAERLQYPTETWAAQDMRKWHVLQYCAWLSQKDASRSSQLQAKADFFYDDVCQTLHQTPTKSLCRPVVLMLQFGWQRNWFQTRCMHESIPSPTYGERFPEKQIFKSQRSIAIGRAKRLIALGFVAGLIFILALLTYGVKRFLTG